MAATRSIKTEIILEGESTFRAEMAKVNANLRTCAAEVRATESAFLTQGRTADTLRDHLKALNNLYDQQKQKLADLEARLEHLVEAGEDESKEADNIRAQMANLTAAMNRTGAQISDTTRELSEMGETTTDVIQAEERLTEAVKKVMDSLVDCTKAATDYESAMAAVSRTTGLTGPELTAMGESFETLSTTIPVAANDLAGIAKTAGQLGVSGAANIESFTETVAKLATAAEMGQDTAATMMAQFSNITGTKDYERLASTIAVLGDSTATTAQKTLEMAQGIAAAGNGAGMSSAEIIAIAAAVGSLGIEAASGGTSMSRLISSLDKAAATGDGLERLARVAGMSANEFKIAWGNNAADALNRFIVGLHNASAQGENMTLILSELGITSQRELQAIKGLAAQGDLLSLTLEKGNEAWEENIGLQEKAATMFTTTEAKMQMAANATENLKVAAGDALLPVIGDAAEGLTDLMEPLTELVKENPEVVTALAGITAGVLGLTASIAAYNAIKASLGTMGALLGSSAGAIAGAGAAIGLVVATVADATHSFNEYAESMVPAGASAEELERQIATLQDRIEEYDEAAKNGTWSEVMQWEYDAAKKALRECTDELDGLRAAEAEATAQEEAHAAYLETTAGKCEVLTADLQDLIAAYQEGYEAAYASLEGQFGLFEKVSRVSAISTADMIDAMGTQRDYWNSYGDNLNLLQQLTAEGIGLNAEMVAGMQDGSAQSVQYAASIAESYKDALAQGPEAVAVFVEEMNAAYADMVEARLRAATEIDKMNLDFDAKMREIVKSADKNAEMATAGQSTLQGWINGLESTSPQMYAAMVDIANEGIAQMQAVFDGATLRAPAVTSQGNSGFTPNGSHAAGLDYVPFDGYIAELHKGEMVLTAAQAKAARQGAGPAGSSTTINLYPQSLSESTIDYLYQRFIQKAGSEI